jgi:hypothetical protein
MAGSSDKKWMQKAVKKPGRVRRYLQDKYGDAAFNSKGNIKMSVLNKVIRYVESNDKANQDGLLQALMLAKTFKRKD